MKNLLLLFALIGLVGCQTDKIIPGPSIAVKGSYDITSYTVNGDTLYAKIKERGSTRIIDKLGINGFLFLITPVAADQVSITTWYFRNGLKYTFTKEVTVKETDYQYLFSPIKENGYAPTVYESRVDRVYGDFYERTVGRGSLVIPLIDSPTAPAPSSPPTVVITAKRS